MFIREGKIELKGQKITTTATWAVAKETKKAIRVQETVTVIRNRDGSTASQEERTYWLPKSQFERFGDFIEIPEWLAREKGVWGLEIHSIHMNGQLLDGAAKVAGLHEGRMAIHADRVYYPAGHPDVSPDADIFEI